MEVDKPTGLCHAFCNITKKGQYMNTVEKNYIYKETTNGSHLSVKYTVTRNKIWEIKLKNETRLCRSDFYLFPCLMNARHYVAVQRKYQEMRSVWNSVGLIYTLIYIQSNS